MNDQTDRERRRQAREEAYTVHMAEDAAESQRELDAPETAAYEAGQVIAAALAMDDHYDMRELLKLWLEGGKDALAADYPEILATLA